MKQFWNEKGKTIVGGIVLIAIAMVVVYFGAKWWLHYANTEAFKGEVNAAIITGIIGILTLIGTILMQAYSTRKMQRLTVRDMIFQQRVVVYQKIFNDMANVTRRIYEFLSHPTEEGYEKIKEGYVRFDDTYWNHHFILSNEVRNALANFKVYIDVFVKVDLYMPSSWEWLLKEVGVENKSIIDPKDIYFEMAKKYYGPALQQMRKELQLKTIDNEIEKLLKP